MSYRRSGLWIAYQMFDKTLVVEFFKGDYIDNTHWQQDIYWFPYNTAEYQPHSVDLRALAQDVFDYIEVQINNATELNPEDLSKNINNQIELANRNYSPTDFSGLGSVILRKNIVEGKNVLTQDMINEPNTIYHIQYDYILNHQEIIVPDNSILLFAGGSISDGNLVGTNTMIVSPMYTIFPSSITFSGTFNAEYAYFEWFEYLDNCIKFAQVAKCNIKLLEKTYDINYSVLNIGEVSIVGSGKYKSTLKAELRCLGNQVFRDFTIDGRISLGAASVSNIEMSDMIFNGNGKKLSGFEFFDNQASYIYFNNCEFTNCDYGINVANKGDAYETHHIYVNNCYFHDNERMNFQMIQRHYTLDNIKYGYHHIYLRNSTFIGRADPDYDQHINVSFDGGAILNSSENAMKDSLPGHIFIDGCHFENGYYVFENAGVSNMTIRNSTFVRNNLPTKKDRLISFSAFIKRDANIWKNGKLLFIGNHVSSDNVTSEWGNDNYFPAVETTVTSNTFIKQTVTTGSGGDIKMSDNSFFDSVILCGSNDHLLEHLVIINNLFRYSDGFTESSNIISNIYGILNEDSTYVVTGNVVYSPVKLMRLFSGIQYLFNNGLFNRFTINDNINAITGAYISSMTNLTVNNEFTIDRNTEVRYYFSNINSLDIIYNTITDVVGSIGIDICSIEDISHIIIKQSTFQNLQDSSIIVNNQIGSIKATIDRDNNKIVINGFTGERNCFITIKTRNFSQLKFKPY